MNTGALGPAAYIALSLIVFAAAGVLYKRTGFFLFHPVLLSVAAVILLLRLFGISYAEYRRGGDYITVFLGPAVVSLGLPLYRELSKVSREAFPLLLTTVFGSLSGIVSAIVPPLVSGSAREVVVSLAPKSVTTPIAMSIAGGLGGIPPLTAAIVVSSGIVGAVLGPLFLRLFGIRSRSAAGLAMGFASHGIGTARALEIGETEGAFGSLGLCLNGIMTSVLTPLVLSFLSI